VCVPTRQAPRQDNPRFDAVPTRASGDPTAYGLQAHSSANDALATAAQSGLFDGYALSSGLPACRAAVAAAAAAQLPVTQSGEPAVLASDVFMTHGASQALALAFGALANTVGDGATPVNVLLPRPGFPLYQTLCEYYGIQCRYYDLNPCANWEADPAQMVDLSDGNTVAVVICTPGNPTGCVWSAHHLREVLAAAQAIGAVVIADEVYSGIIWAPKAATTPVAALSQHVPVLSIGALSKRYLVPGWRCGWLVCHDRGRLLAKARILEALHHLVQMSIGPTVPVQACVPHVLANTPREWHDTMCALYAAAAATCAEAVAATPGLDIDCMPQGAMYLLVRLDLQAFDGTCNASDVAWAAALQREEAVVLLPGTAFGAPGRVRFVLCVTPAVLTAAWTRITAFCTRHHTGVAV
jgi:tyrosine aminotransferase